MKARVLQEDLLKGLLSASRFVATRNPLPVLSNILLVAEKGKLKIAATNLETGISLQIGAKIEEEGSLTVPAKIIVELVSNLPAGQTELETEEGILTIKSGTFSARVAGIDAREFPPVPEKIEKKSLTFPLEMLKKIHNRVVYAAANDETRPVLTGVLFMFSGKDLSCVATDGFRLSLQQVEYPGKSTEETKIIVPAKLIEEVTKVLGANTEVDVAVLDKEKQLIFTDGSTTLTGRLLEGDYPPYERIIPKKHVYKAIIDKDELVRAIKASAVFARESASIVRFKITEVGIDVFAESQQYGSEHINVEAKTEGLSEGDSTEVAFNYKYVLDFLSSVEKAGVTLETEGPTSPGVFRSAKDGSYLHLIMPVKIQA